MNPQKNETGNAALKASPIPQKEKERKRKESKKNIKKH